MAEGEDYNVLKYLAQHYEVTLISFVRGDQARDVDRLRQYCKAVHTSPRERGPLTWAWFGGTA